MSQIEQATLDIKIAAESANTTLNKLNTASGNLLKTLSDVSDQVDEIIKKFDKLAQQPKNVTNSTVKANISNVKHSVTGLAGTMTSDTAREQRYKDMQDAVIAAQQAEVEEIKARTEAQKAITKDVNERAKYRGQDSNSKKTWAEAYALAVSKKIDENSTEYLEALKARTNALNESKNYRAYREKHPELFATGGQYASWRLQGARMASTLGNAASQLGTGGRIVGDALNIGAGLLRAPAAGVTGIFATLGKSLMDLGKAATTAFADIEATKTQLGVVFSNQTQANAMFGDISQYAVKSPFGIQQTSELAILLKQSGVYASDLMDTLKMLGDTAGGNMEKMKRIANNYAQIVSIGKASMLDMRQFAYAGIPIFEAVSKELGVSQQELRTLISDGKVTSDIIEKVFKDLTGINGIFGNATEKGAKTLKARLQNLSDAKQLAMASMGELGYSLGTQTGNDSAANRLVTTVENIYSWIHDKANTINIERSVKTIENRENKIKQTENLIKYIENDKNSPLKDLLPGLKEVLKQEMNKRDADKERATYLASYNMKAKGWLDAAENGETRSLKEMQDELESLVRQRKHQKAILNSKAYTAEDRRNAKITVEGLDIQIQKLDDLINYAKKFNQLTEEELRANRENNLLTAQSLAYDKENKESRATDSLNSQFQKLYELYSSSEEVKAKKQQEEITALKLAQNELKNLSKKTDTKGTLDFTKLSKEEYEKYSRAGAFNNVRKLTVTEGKTEAQLGDDRKLLTTNVNKALSEIGENLKATPQTLEASKRIGSEFERITKIVDNDEFYRNFSDFNAYFDTQIKELQKKYPRLKNILQSDISYFNNALNVKEVRRGGENVNVEEAYNKGKEYIPLWKRILAQYTGLTTQGMTGTAQTLNNYSNDMAIRSLASGVMGAALNNGSVASSVELLRSSGVAKELKGTSGATYQIDWVETKKNLHEFAMQLSASTDVISAYRSGLENELNTYNQLLVAAYTESESQDLNQQKTVSDKKLGEILKNADEQLVNAFGEGLSTADGIKVHWDKNQQSFVDTEGNEIAEKTFILEGTIKDTIEKEAARLRKEIRESGIQELNNQTLASLLKEVSPTLLQSYAMQSLGANQVTGYLLNDSAYAQRAYDYAMTERKAGSSLKDTSNSDILILAKQGNAEAQKLVDDVFKTIKNGVDSLVNSPSYKSLQELRRTSKRDSAVNARLLALTGNDKEGAAEALSSEGYGGWRGARNLAAKWYGVGRDFDREDLLLAAARMPNKYTSYNADGSVRERTNGFGIDASKFEGMGDNEILDTMTEAEKKMISMLDYSEQMKDAFRDMGDSIGQALTDAGKSAYLAPFEALGESLIKGDEAAADLESNMKNIAADLLKNVGTAMATAGFQIAGAAALSQNWAGVAGGLALAAAGGFASGLGGALFNNDNDDDSSEDETKKLESLRDSIVDLLAQAREDALYYENTLRHKKALSTNSELGGTTTSVNDAIITPQGNVITTHPDDYLIATKTPQTLIGGSGSPNINFNLVDKSTGVQVTTQKASYDKETNTIDFEAVIESKMVEFISSSKSDDAFNAREARQRGMSVIA